MTDTSTRSETDRPDPDPRPRTLEVVASGEEYTFVPRDADGEELVTSWITADREDIVDLESWR